MTAKVTIVFTDEAEAARFAASLAERDVRFPADENDIYPDGWPWPESVVSIRLEPGKGWPRDYLAREYRAAEQIAAGETVTEHLPGLVGAARTLRPRLDGRTAPRVGVAATSAACNEKVYVRLDSPRDPR